MHQIQKRSIGWAVRILCAVSLLMVAFAHRVNVYAPDPVEMAAYVLPDGTMPVICMTGADGKPVTQHPDNHCDFCQIASGSACVDASLVLVGNMDLAGAIFRPSSQGGPVRRVLSQNSPLRGPPLFIHTA